MNALVVCLSLLLSSCAFGGGDGYHSGGVPSDGVPPDDGPAIDAGSGNANGSGPRADASSGQSTGRSDASVSADASGGESDSGPVVSIDAAVTPGSGTNSCMASPPLPVCDPVKNTGCPPINVCSLDATGAAQTGLCQITTIGLGSCADGNSTLCDAKTTCVERKCVPTCYCDADCADGKKCSGAAPGAAGPVKLCQ